MKLLVISSYPEQNSLHSEKTVGVASYSKTLLTSLKKNHPELSITVLAETFRKREGYTEDGIFVKRMWKRASIIGLVRMFWTALMSKRTKLLIPFEAHMFGNPYHTIFALLLLSLLKLFGKTNYILIHQVVGDFHELEQNHVKASALNLVKRLLYRLLSLASTKQIVFEQHLLDQLKMKSAVVIPHIIPEVKHLSQNDARGHLGWDDTKQYALYFGFLAPYKGIDRLIAEWPKKSTVQLVIAGGQNPNHQRNKKIADYITNVLTDAHRKHIMTTGFVPEKEIPYYFCAADTIVLPYRTFFSSSGPLALALAYGTPILLSKALSGYEKSIDFQEALKKTKLTIHDLLLPAGSESLEQIPQMLHTKRAQLEEFAKQMRQSRTADRIAEAYYKTLFA